jgi:ribosomal protein S18 acetylase RimI-like enzyme
MLFEPTLRSAVVSDAESLSALGIQVWLHTYATQGVRANIAQYVLAEFTPEYFRATIGGSDNHLVVAEHCNNLLGYSLVKMDNICPGRQHPSAELDSLYIQEHFTGLGVGTKLLYESEKIAERHGEKLWLTVNAENKRGIAFYRQREYQEVGVDYFDLDSERHKNYVFIQPPT